MNIKKIIKNYLFATGADGLCNNIKKCQCKKEKIKDYINKDCIVGKYDNEKNIIGIDD